MYNYARIKDGLVVGIQQSLNEINSDDLVLTDNYDESILNKKFDGNSFIDAQVQQGIRKIHKADFIERMLPWWADIKVTRAVDSIVDGYFEMFGFYKHVDLDWAKTVFLVNDLKERILIVVPESTFNVEELLKGGTQDEAA